MATSAEYVYASGGSQTHVPVSYDITYSYIVPGTSGTPDVPGNPAYLQLGNDTFVSFNADTQLVFHVDGAAVTLAQLETMTTVGLADIDNAGALDTVILFGDDKTLTLLNAGVDNLGAIADHIQIA